MDGMILLSWPVIRLYTLELKVRENKEKGKGQGEGGEGEGWSDSRVRLLNLVRERSGGC